MDDSPLVHPAVWLACMFALVLVVGRFAVSGAGRSFAARVGSPWLQPVLWMLLLVILVAGARSYSHSDYLTIISYRGDIHFRSSWGDLYAISNGNWWPFHSKPHILVTSLPLANLERKSPVRWQGVNYYRYTSVVGEEMHGIVISYWLPALILSSLIVWSLHVRKAVRKKSGGQTDPCEKTGCEKTGQL